MPYDEPDETDPLEAMAIEMPGSRASWREMAACFAEEFARMGFTAARIRSLFDSPVYQGPFKARQVLGKRETDALIAEAVFVFGRPKPPIQDAPGLDEDDEGSAHPAGPCDVRHVQD